MSTSARVAPIAGCVLAGAAGMLVACSGDSGPPSVSSFHYVETVTGNIEGKSLDSREEGWYQAPDSAHIISNVSYSALGLENAASPAGQHLRQTSTATTRWLVSRGYSATEDNTRARTRRVTGLRQRGSRPSFPSGHTRMRGGSSLATTSSSTAIHPHGGKFSRATKRSLAICLGQRKSLSVRILGAFIHSS